MLQVLEEVSGSEDVSAANVERLASGVRFIIEAWDRDDAGGRSGGLRVASFACVCLTKEALCLPICVSYVSRHVSPENS